MNPAEAQLLLGIAASFDNRKPSEEAAIAWSHALGDLPFVDCRDAVVAHYQVSSDWIMPAKVIAEVKRVRAKRIVDHPPLTPPPHACETDDCTCVEFHQQWRADANRRIANGEVIDCDAAYGELKPRRLPDLRALMSTTPERPTVTNPAADEARAVMQEEA